MKILCLIKIHNWSNWVYVRPVGRYESRLRSTCKRSGKVKLYDGMTEQVISTGELSPYKYKT